MYKDILLTPLNLNSGTGYVGKATRMHMMNTPQATSIKSNNSIVPKIQLSSSIKTNTSLPRDLELGMQGDDVRTLQKFLNAFGYQIASSGDGSPGNETTYFGPATQSAVIRYQNDFKEILLIPLGLTESLGYVGRLTRDEMMKRALKTQDDTI